jgi:hypothetical protein
MKKPAIDPAQAALARQAEQERIDITQQRLSTDTLDLLRRYGALRATGRSTAARPASPFIGARF